MDQEPETFCSAFQRAMLAHPEILEVPQATQDGDPPYKSLGTLRGFLKLPEDPQRLLESQITDHDTN